MRAKLDRLAKERQIINTKNVSSQADLLEALKKEGVKITQATLSRDLKVLKVAKAANPDGSYQYVLPTSSTYRRVVNPVPATDVMRENGIVSIAFSGNIGVVKTAPCVASAVSAQLESENHPEILGTVAGYDTVLVVVREGTDTNLLSKTLGFSEE